MRVLYVIPIPADLALAYLEIVAHAIEWLAGAIRPY